MPFANIIHNGEITEAFFCFYLGSPREIAQRVVERRELRCSWAGKSKILRVKN